MKMIYSLTRVAVVLVGTLLLPRPVSAADHNDPNSINSIFYDLQVSPADLYDLERPGHQRLGRELGAHVLYHSAMILMAAGQIEEARKLLPETCHRHPDRLPHFPCTSVNPAFLSALRP